MSFQSLLASWVGLGIRIQVIRFARASAYLYSPSPKHSFERHPFSVQIQALPCISSMNPNCYFSATYLFIHKTGISVAAHDGCNAEGKSADVFKFLEWYLHKDKCFITEKYVCVERCVYTLTYLLTYMYVCVCRVLRSSPYCISSTEFHRGYLSQVWFQ